MKNLLKIQEFLIILLLFACCWSLDVKMELVGVYCHGALKKRVGENVM